jgi:ribonucleoside-triphosphate reductase
MDIKLNLNKRFVGAINEMNTKYGENFSRVNGLHNSNLNFTDFIDHFIDSQNVADVSIDANANSSTKDIRTLLGDMMKPHGKLLGYNKIFYEMTKKYGCDTAKEWFEQEWNGGFYLHDSATVSYIPYCYAYDLTALVERGLFFVDKFKTEPAKHLTTYNDHVLEFISWTANRSSGAVGLPNYLIYSYYYWQKDVKDGFYMKSPEYYRRQVFQKFIYDLNQPYLRISECAFTNISIMDRNYLEELFGGLVFPDGEFAIDHIDEIIEHQKVFMEVVSEVREKCMMTFPVLTYSLLYQEGRFVDEDFARWCNKHNMKWYDSNFYVGSDVTSLSNCCRLISDTSKLNAFINSIGGTALSVGSIKVNTINLRRIAIESGGDKEKYLQILRKKVQLCIKTLDVVREIIKRNVEKGLLPNYTHGLIEMDKQYNTIGITAMYEVIADFGLIEEDDFGYKSYSDEGLSFAKEILNVINEEKDSVKFDYSLNVECIPAERANVVLCEKDNLLYPEIENQYYIYSNQWIPLTEDCSVKEKIKLGAILDKECGGGQISHINIAAPFVTEEQAWNLLNKIAKEGVIYFAYNIKIATCENGHGFIGNICPQCGGEVVDTFQRIVGYLTPSKSYSKQRKREFSERKWFDFGEGVLS